MTTRFSTSLILLVIAVFAFGATATADPYFDDVDACMQAGFDEYLPKPFDAEDLRDLIARWGTKPAGRGLASLRA